MRDLKKLESLITNLHKAKGEFHTQQAYCLLMKYMDLPCIEPVKDNYETKLSKFARTIKFIWN